MIRSDECRKRIKELEETLRILGDNESQEAYKRVIIRQIEGYQRELTKALQRHEPPIGDGIGYGNHFKY